MKVLLINPPMDNIVGMKESAFMSGLMKSNPVPPLGLMYVASYAEKYGHKVRIMDMNVDQISLWSKVDEFKPDIVGITATTLTLYDALQVAKKIKAIGNIPVVIGGAHCNIYPEETSYFKEIDYVVRGEGELPFIKLNKRLPDIELVENLDDIPFPARHLIDIKKYHTTLSKHKLVGTMCSSRGCPLNCIFCYQPHFGKRWRARSAGNVVEEIKECVKLGIGEIEIYDDTFTYDRTRVLMICELLLQARVKVDWNIRTRVDRVDLEMLKLMARAGCKRINYGIESVNPEILKILKKGFTVEQIKNAIKWTKEAGIEIQAYFMLGSPTETEKQMLETIQFANKYIPDYCYYSITTPFPGTQLYENGIKEKRYRDNWREFAEYPLPDFKLDFWSNGEFEKLNKMVEYGYKSFYRRPSYILRQLMKVRSFQELKNKAIIAKEVII
jgi:anaerobic magnesium-protoporphyrin IX monomethyl ester cyclase